MNNLFSFKDFNYSLRILLPCILLLISGCVHSQTEELRLGKEEFSKDFEKQDYKKAVDHLEKAVKLEPSNAEAHYFLGYAYDRLNAKDGRDMAKQDLALTIKSSDEFETVNKLSPKYEGEYLVLDPYSKITAIWGSQAMAYLNGNKIDSAKWAFTEGRKRGGFGDFFLSVNRIILNTCSANSYLITSGDNFSIPAWYLQLIEGLRTDVSLIDISLLNTIWYPKYLLQQNKIELSLTNSVLDSIEYREWKDTSITIPLDVFPNKFTWTVKANYQNKYLLRGGLIFLNLVETNKFKRNIYFTTAFPKEDQLGLDNYFDQYFLMDKVSSIKNQNWTDSVIVGINSFDFSKLDSKRIVNSVQELNTVNTIRYEYCNVIQELLSQNRKKEAKELYGSLNRNIPEEQYPYTTKDIERYIKHLSFD